MNTEKPVLVAVLTPYLVEYKGDYSREAEQIPNCFTTEKRKVHFDFRWNGYDDKRRDIDVDLADLVIAGCTYKGECEVQCMRGTGLIIARFSKFYGRPSEYTGKMPGESGYSLDMHKSADTVRVLLTDDKILDSLVSRNEIEIINALAKFNKERWEPVIPTHHLTEALKVKK